MGSIYACGIRPQGYLQRHPSRIFYLNWLVLGQTFISPYSFSQATPFWSTGVVLKRTGMFVCGSGTLHSLSSDSSSQLDVPGHDGDSLCMDGAQVGVFKQALPDRPLLLLEDIVSPLTGIADLF